MNTFKTILRLSLTISTLLMLNSLPAAANNPIQQQDSLVQETAQALVVAHDAALSKGNTVILCISDTGKHCADNASGEEWRRGWLIFDDRNNNLKQDPDEEVLRSHAPFKNTDGLILVSKSARIPYQADGSSAETLQLHFCASTTPEASGSHNRSRPGLSGQPGSHCSNS
jgi:Tfp pilus assembly protein FimT